MEGKPVSHQSTRLLDPWMGHFLVHRLVEPMAIGIMLLLLATVLVVVMIKVLARCAERLVRRH
jgi:hypothetical protein